MIILLAGILLTDPTQSFVYDTFYTISNEERFLVGFSCNYEANASELLKNIKDVSPLFNMFKYSTTW